MNPRRPCPAASRVDCGLQHFSVFTWCFQRSSLVVHGSMLILWLTKCVVKRSGSALDARKWRENAHFLDEAHTFEVRYFSFLLVNDKLTLCLHGNMVVCDHPTYNNHHHASGFDYEPNINLKRPVHRRVPRYRVVDLFRRWVRGCAQGRGSQLRTMGNQHHLGSGRRHGDLPDRRGLRCAP
ncbi:Uncharacterised protein [Klebsiella pneumoniae]|nr:Uncharacterised protein [Klebsiella pneumoniae]